MIRTETATQSRPTFQNALSPSVGRHARPNMLRRAGEALGRHARTAAVLGAVALASVGVQNKHAVENLVTGVEQTLSAQDYSGTAEATPLLSIDLMDSGSNAVKSGVVKVARPLIRMGLSRRSLRAPGKFDSMYVPTAEQGYSVEKPDGTVSSIHSVEAMPTPDSDVAMHGVDVPAVHSTQKSMSPAEATSQADQQPAG